MNRWREPIPAASELGRAVRIVARPDALMSRERSALARGVSFRSFDDVLIRAYLACAERVQEAENRIQALH